MRREENEMAGKGKGKRSAVRAPGTYELADLNGERLEEARHGRLHLVGGHLRQLLGHVLQVLGHALLVDVHRVLRARVICKFYMHIHIQSEVVERAVTQSSRTQRARVEPARDRYPTGQERTRFRSS